MGVGTANERLTGSPVSRQVFEALGKHFVTLSANCVAPGASPDDEQAFVVSGFVTELKGQWLYVTAGHVLEDIEEYKRAGVVFDFWRLGDQTAGNDYDHGIPYDFNPDNWVIVRDDRIGLDYAAVPLEPLLRRTLEAGGVVPIDKSAWGPVPLDAFDELVLVGVAAETVKYLRPGIIGAKATMVPLKLTTTPASAGDTEQNKFFAKLIFDNSEVRINNLKGMSGGPIFGIKKEQGKRAYWAIGVQSGWYDQSNVISACPLSSFLLALESAVEDAEKARPHSRGPRLSQGALDAPGQC